jgi:crossover junction endodeoxyribonuclease RuvC
MKILGIDPGTSRVGFGLIETSGGLSALRFGTIEAKEKGLPEKIASITTQFRSLLKELKPDIAAIEKIYFTKNQKTAMSVAQARGALLSIVMEHGVTVTEYNPNEVKIQVTGYGLADKKGVAKMVKAILKMEELPGYDDASDALAIAIACANEQKLLTLKRTNI